MSKKLNKFTKKVINTIKKPEMKILPGQLAFFFVVSIIPLIALFGALAPLVHVSIDSLTTFINTTFPRGAANLLLPIITDNSLSFNLGVFFVSAFILASNGAHSMIIASNMIYKVNNRDVVYRRIKAIFMTLVLVILLLFVLLVPAFGDYIVSGIVKVIKDPNLPRIITTIYQIFKYPVSILLIYFFVKLLYTIAPDTKIKSADTTTGALVTTISWILATEIYSWYVSLFNTYDVFYGGLSNILILLLWVYLLAYIFVLGMALNAGQKAIEGEIIKVSEDN